MFNPDQDFKIIMIDAGNGEEEYRGPASEFLAVNQGDEEVAAMVDGLARHPELVLPVGFYRFCRELPESDEEG